mmetsp:Transcript_1590/g.3627  ORF Transcript_1590/g.3627 Transcript_1590/m.3627 type:complete len:208 (-) Transcript_1590:380-1003(-)
MTFRASAFSGVWSSEWRAAAETGMTASGMERAVRMNSSVIFLVFGLLFQSPGARSRIISAAVSWTFPWCGCRSSPSAHATDFTADACIGPDTPWKISTNVSVIDLLSSGSSRRTVARKNGATCSNMSRVLSAILDRLSPLGVLFWTSVSSSVSGCSVVLPSLSLPISHFLSIIFPHNVSLASLRALPMEKPSKRLKTGQPFVHKTKT